MKRAVLALAMFSAPAPAQDSDAEPESTQIVYQEITEHTFGGVDVFLRFSKKNIFLSKHEKT